MTPADLIAFEDDIAAEFAAGNIKAPVHLAGGNESQILEVFRDIAADDWVLSTWRSHYVCLAKGVPPDELKAAILRGRSIGLCFPKQRVLSSAIVGGICPIAVGLAWAIKKKGKSQEKVHVFLGDMSAMSGIFRECQRYCVGHLLPVRWIVEDNGLSVCTDTLDVWGRAKAFPDMKVINYKMTRPHVGVGKFIKF